MRQLAWRSHNNEKEGRFLLAHGLGGFRRGSSVHLVFHLERGSLSWWDCMTEESYLAHYSPWGKRELSFLYQSSHSHTISLWLYQRVNPLMRAELHDTAPPTGLSSEHTPFYIGAFDKKHATFKP